jgi:ketosteroid isomerase-like protein
VRTVAQIAREYWDSEESRDVERILRHFVPDAKWRGPGRTSVGHFQIREFYDDSVAAFPHLIVRILGSYGSDHEAAVEWCAALTDTDGQFHELHGMNLMECDGNRIVSLITYFDPAELDHLLAGSHAAH